jgi:phenylpropionate dioxygenase-like ring-hydroxylating dioxygenase large terminal subunit
VTPEDNVLLTRVGPGTAMGALMRRYWLPLCESAELGPPDGAPRRMRRLGEDLVAFRDSGGRPALLAEACPHRRASLFLGRNEENGLRCVYHGWKFDADGGCVDMPTEPASSKLRERVRAVAYPCRERNGIVWTRLSAAGEPARELPSLGWAEASPERRSVLTYQRACNWLQALEGDVDTAHLAWLHARFGPEGEREVAFHEGDRLRDGVVRDPQPALEVAESEAGVTIAARRDHDASHHYWRVSHFLMPIYTSVPSIGEEHRAKAWVPLDDAHTEVWEFTWGPLPRVSAAAKRIPASGLLAESAEPLSRGRFAANRSNDYLLDRERQRRENFSGIEESPPLQDAAVQESMGAIVDRSLEHLGATDVGIVRVRRRLLDAAIRLRDRGDPPPGSADPDAYRLHGSQFVIPRDADWRAHTGSGARSDGPKGRP